MTAFLPAPIGGLPLVWGFMGSGFWILLLALIVLLVRRVRPAGRESGGSALRLLEERYACGEITRDDFLERRGVLGGSSPTEPRDET
jgi:uncharacterized membrane protein